MDHETQAKQKTMKNVMRGLAALMVPLTASFPVAIFAYWIPSNIFTFIQVRCHIPAAARHIPAAARHIPAAARHIPAAALFSYLSRVPPCRVACSR
jgi:hypothetical protein